MLMVYGIATVGIIVVWLLGFLLAKFLNMLNGVNRLQLIFLPFKVFGMVVCTILLCLYFTVMGDGNEHKT